MTNEQQAELALELAEAHPQWTPDDIIGFVEYISSGYEEDAKGKSVTCSFPYECLEGFEAMNKFTQDVITAFSSEEEKPSVDFNFKKDDICGIQQLITHLQGLLEDE